MLGKKKYFEKRPSNGTPTEGQVDRMIRQPDTGQDMRS